MLFVCVAYSQGCGLDGISVEAKVKARLFHRGQGRGQIEAGLLAVSNQQVLLSQLYFFFFFG